MELTGFETLKVYTESTKLRREIFDLVSSFPKDEKYRLSDQLIRNTRKCPANIAEGYGRFHYQENIQYCRIARGSCETKDHLSVALECRYIDAAIHAKISNEINNLLKMINGYINFLKKQKNDK